MSIFLINSCKSVKKTNFQTENILQYCNFIEITSPFAMRILQYLPSECYCGTRSCASNCVGIISNNDSIRVLSICNMDTSYMIGQTVIVYPIPQPKSQVMIAQSRIIVDGRISLSDLDRKKLNTIYGSLSKK